MKLALVQPQLAQASDRTNLDVISALLDPWAPELEGADVVLLPEHFDGRASQEEYESGLRELARRLHCHVIGGSHHQERPDGSRVNTGAVVDPQGNVLTAYDKLRPYADERHVVEPGSRLGEITIGGRRVLVLICADFWFSDLFDRVDAPPELVLVPALSVTRKSGPEYSRALWQHLAVTRAYEFGTFVGISDWAHPSKLVRLLASGVAGLADPTGTEPDRFFAPVGEGGVSVYDLDFDALDAFRRDRLERGFFYKRP